MKPEIQKIINTDMARLACLLDLLADHPDIQDNAKLYGAIDAIKHQYIDIWNRLDAELDKLLLLSLTGDPGELE